MPLPPEPPAGPLSGHRGRALTALCGLTVREVLRGHAVTLSLVGMAGALALGEAASAVSISAHSRMVVDAGLAAMSCAGLALGVGVGQGLIARELAPTGASVLLAQPLPRACWLVGRFVGVWAVIVAATWAMAAMQVGLLAAQDIAVPAGYYWAVAAVPLETGVATAVAMALACASSRAVAAVAAATLVLAGYGLDGMVAMAASRGAELVPLAQGLRSAMPQLGRLNLRPWAARDLPVPDGLFVWASLYAASYGAAWLTLGAWALRRRR